MPSYRFYPVADTRQDDIWRDTVERWGEAQAETYIRGLHTRLQQLADRAIPWIPLPQHLVSSPDRDVPIYMHRYERHFLCFRVLSNEDIGVITILHTAMNIPVRLQEDIKGLEEMASRLN